MDIRKYILLILLVFASVTQMQAQADRQFIRNGNKLYRQQNYAKAETEYRKALSKNARNTQAMYNLGCALMMQQKDSAAIVQLQNAGRSEQSPRRKAMAYHNIGVICQGHQMYGEAIEAYKESLRNNPIDNETRYNLALCQRLQKKQKQNGGKNNQKNKNKKDNKNQQNKQKNNNQNKQDQNNQQKQQPKDQMSKDNAQQLLNYAIQQEKATQERLKRNEQQPQRRRLQQNW
mgnify:FL=1